MPCSRQPQRWAKWKQGQPKSTLGLRLLWGLRTRQKLERRTGPPTFAQSSHEQSDRSAQLLTSGGSVRTSASVAQLNWNITCCLLALPRIATKEMPQQHPDYDAGPYQLAQLCVFSSSCSPVLSESESRDIVGMSIASSALQHSLAACILHRALCAGQAVKKVHMPTTACKWLRHTETKPPASRRIRRKQM